MKQRILLFKRLVTQILSRDNFKWVPVTASLVAVIILTTGCEVDDFTEELSDAQNNAPTVSIIAPGDTVGLAGFTATAMFTDDTPGLSLATYNIIDSLGNVAFSQEYVLIGTSDSIAMNVPADTLNIGSHTFSVTVSDTKGLETTVTSDFEVVGTLSNQDQMFVLGSINGWGGTDLQMTLVDDYTWVVKPVKLTPTDEFKFVNTSDFSDVDWEDPECDGVATQDGGGNIGCGYADGSYILTFNDQTLEYSVEPILSVQSQMYVLGSMNGWGGTDLEMSLIDNYTWQVEDVAMTASDEFKFVNTSDFSDVDWEDPECDGQATQDGGGNIACQYEGTFVLTFNDQTLEYSVE